MDWIDTEIERKYHKVADLFPLLTGADFDELKADIGQNGLFEAIWLHADGSIIDGRNRHRACIETETEPVFRTWNEKGSLVAFVVSMNLHRRHLTSSQRAVIALDVMPMLEEEARKRQLATLKQNTVRQFFAEREAEPRPRDQAASMFQTNRQYVQDAKTLQQQAPDLLESVKSGDVSIPKAMDKLHERNTGATASQQVQVTIFSHETVEYYTPPQYIDAARDVMGSIDLDPASCEAAQKTICASTFYTEENDGLQAEWFGHVWLNPPYSKTDGKSNQGTWSHRLAEQYRNGNVQEAILLVKAALGYKWFEDIWCDWPVCFARERLSFIKADGTSDGQSKQGTAFLYFGPRPERFKEVFTQFGRVIMPEET